MKYYYGSDDTNRSQIEYEGIVVIDDLDTFGTISKSRVIIFEDTSGANKAIDELRSTKDVDVAFKAALAGDAEEISIEKLVRFYLENKY